MDARIGLIACLALNGCAAPQQRVMERPGKPDFVYSSGRDAEMEAAFQEAKRSLGTFVAELEKHPPTIGKHWPKLTHPQEKEADFTIKVAYPKPGGGREHLWIRVARHQKGVFQGFVANEPVHLTDVKLDQPVEIPKSNVEDWMIKSASGDFQGGYSVKLMVKRGAKLPKD